MEIGGGPAPGRRPSTACRSPRVVASDDGARAGQRRDGRRAAGGRDHRAQAAPRRRVVGGARAPRRAGRRRDGGDPPHPRRRVAGPRSRPTRWRSTGRCSTGSASRTRPSSSGFRWLEAHRPPANAPVRRPRRPAAGQPARRTRTGCGRSSTGSSPTSATRWRTSGGSASGPGGSGRRCPPVAWRPGRRSWPPTRRPAARPSTSQALRWWEVLGTLKWGVICMMQAWAHLSGASRSMELATIGRRVCENEWDVLGLLPGAAARAPRPAGARSRARALHDRPTMAELRGGGAGVGRRRRARRHRGSPLVPRPGGHQRAHDGRARAGARAGALARRTASASRARLRRRSRSSPPGSAAGELDDRLDEVRTLVAASVHDKLLVANPGWLDEG